MLEFIDKILENLKENGFPEKKVSLPTVKMYEAADKRGLSFNKVVEEIKSNMAIEVIITDEKVLFSAIQNEPEVVQDEEGFNPDSLASMFGNMDKNQLFSQAQEMLKKMDPEQVKKMQDMFLNMSDEEKEEIMKKGKDLGLI